MPTIDDIRARITAACEKMQARGFRIAPGGYMTLNCCCPMGALVGSPRMLDFQYDEDAMLILDVGRTFIRGLVYGFEDWPIVNGLEVDADAYRLGTELRARYVTPEPPPSP